MVTLTSVKEIIDLDMWSSWATAPLEEEGKDERARSSVGFGKTMNFFTFDHHNKFLSNAHGHILPRSDCTHNVKGVNIYASFDSLETYRLFFESVTFKIFKNEGMVESFPALDMITCDIWEYLKPSTPEGDVIPAPAFDFGICGHVLFEKPIENPNQLQMLSEDTFVKKMNEIAHNRMFHRMTGIEKSAKITIKLFGEKTRVVL